MVLVVPLMREGAFGYVRARLIETSQLAFQRAKCLSLGLSLTLGLGPLLALQRVESGCQFACDAAADILTHEFAIDPLRSRVVPRAALTSLPAHVVSRYFE